MSFININNKQENVKATYSAFVIREALLSIETKDVAKADAIVESIEGELTLNEALEFFSAKLKAMNALNIALLNEAAQEEWVGYIEYPKGKKLEKTFKTSRAANTWSRKNMDDILSQKDVESIGTMSKKEWDKHEAKYALTESLDINEGTMSEIHMLAKEAKNIAEFTKKFFKEFGDKIKKTAETIEWVESLYTDVVAESLVTERSINKIQKEFTEVVNDMATTVANWKTAEGDTKIQLLDKLKALTARKTELTSELDSAVMGKDKDAVLSAVAESVVTEKAKPYAAAILDFLNAVEKAGNFENIGKELKAAGYEFEFEDNKNNPAYKVKHDGSTFAIANKKYWGRQYRAIEKKVGDIAIGWVFPNDTYNESIVTEAKKDLKVGDTGIDYNDNVVEVIEIGKFDKVAKSFKKEMKADAEDYGYEKAAGDFYLTKTIETEEGNVGDLAIYPVKYDMSNYWGLTAESVVNEAKFFRLPNKLNAMWDLKNSVDYIVGKHDAGNDYNPADMRTIEEFIKKIKQSAKSFKDAEEVKGTVYESLVNESFVAYTENSKGEYEVVKVLKDQRAAKAWRKKNAYLLDDDSVDVKSIGTTPKKDWDKTHPELATESLVNEAKGFKNTTDFEKFLIEIDGMGESQIKKIMGKDYIDTPGYYQDEKGDYDDVEDFMRSNMGTKEFEKLESWWESNVAESVVNEANIKVTKNEWPYVEFKVGGKKHKVEFDYEDVIDDHGNEGQDQFWIGKDDDGKEWSIDVYADYNGNVEEVHYDTIVAETKNVTFTFEAEETPSWNNLMETINYKLNEDLRRGLKKYIKQNEDELNKLADEDAFDTIYDNIRAEFDITEGTKEDRDMIETFKFMF